MVSGRTPPPDFYHFRPAAIRNDIFTSTYSPGPDPLATHAKAGEPRARRRNARHAADEVGQTGALAVIEEERSMGDAAKQVTIPVRKVDSGASHAC